ncbi:MAG: LytR/AlgR family response regulator transcription factor [Bacteroidota bacterium]
MRTLIIEDEAPAANRLAKLIHKIEPEAIIECTLDSVSSALRWFDQHTLPDLVFMDINLGDGLSFEIFEKTEIDCPVIFITAYDEYAIKAFKVNSIDYLLKPLKEDELRKSIEKYKQFRPNRQLQSENLKALFEQIKNPEKEWKQRFVVHFGDKLKSVETSAVAYFMIIEKNTFLVTHQNDSFGINYSLDQIIVLIDPSKFFRVNRKYIVSFKSIKNMWSYSRSRVKLMLDPPAGEDVIVSTDRSSAFKDWLDQ